MWVKSIAEFSFREHSAILSTSLSYHLSLRPLFCLFLSGRFTFRIVKKKTFERKSMFQRRGNHFFKGAATKGKNMLPLRIENNFNGH